MVLSQPYSRFRVSEPFRYTDVKLQGHTYIQSQIIELKPRASLKELFFVAKSL